MRVNIKVHARAKRDCVSSLPDGSLKVDVKAPPVDGEANKAICEVLAKHFGVHKRDVSIVVGESNHKKVVEVNNV